MRDTCTTSEVIIISGDLCPDTGRTGVHRIQSQTTVVATPTGRTYAPAYVTIAVAAVA